VGWEGREGVVGVGCCEDCGCCCGWGWPNGENAWICGERGYYRIAEIAVGIVSESFSSNADDSNVIIVQVPMNNDVIDS
jgi:hypothetical protein